MAELRCPHKMHGVVDEVSETITVKCSNSRCGARSGVIVLHKFDVVSGSLLETKKFQDPILPHKGGETNGDSSVRTSVRH